eukprot:6162998-Pyramimonas_sp.AAC.1
MLSLSGKFKFRLSLGLVPMYWARPYVFGPVRGQSVLIWVVYVEASRLGLYNLQLSLWDLVPSAIPTRSPTPESRREPEPYSLPGHVSGYSNYTTFYILSRGLCLHTPHAPGHYLQHGLDRVRKSSAPL